MYYFIVNLTSRTGKAAKTWHQLKLELDQREVAYKAYVSEYPGHATRLAKMICNKADKDIRLIVVGGDGTANEVINGMEHFEKVTCIRQNIFIFLHKKTSNIHFCIIVYWRFF